MSQASKGEESNNCTGSTSCSKKAEASLLKSPPLTSEIDQLLCAQLIVAWAGEKGGEEKRLGWWKSDLLSEFGGRDLLRRLVPRTAEWAVLQAVREAARRTDESAREQGHDSDLLISLYSLGFEVDERTDERLQELKQSGQPPFETLSSLQPLLGEPWSEQGFVDWAEGHGEDRTEDRGKDKFTVTASGRECDGSQRQEAVLPAKGHI